MHKRAFTRGQNISAIHRVGRRRPRGIFCLEDDWWGIRSKTSVEPVLHLLNQWDPYYVPYVHRNVATLDALEYYLKKWSQKRYDDYPLLYLGFHGSPGLIHLSSGRSKHHSIDLDWFEDQLRNKCKRRMIFIASCSTIDIHGHRLQRFLRQTGALAVCGYTGNVDWLQSATFDALVLGALQDNAMTASGARAMRRRVEQNGCGLGRALQFRMLIKN
jgi:hypothetical protein